MRLNHGLSRIMRIARILRGSWWWGSLIPVQQSVYNNDHIIRHLAM